MNNIYRYIVPTLFLLGLAAMLSACTDDDSQTTYGLLLSDYMYDFSAGGGEVTIEVTTSYPQAWDIGSQDVDWLTEINRTVNTITYQAAPNHGSTKRMAEIIIKAGTLSKTVKFTQKNIRDIKATGLYVFDDTQVNPVAISSSGKYILTSTTVTQDNESMIEFNLFDTETYESTYVVRTNEPITGIAAVTDNGIIFASVRKDGMPDDIIIKDGNIERPQVPEGYNSPGFRGASADGVVVAGFCFKTGAGTVTHPVRWTNGVPEVLEYPDVNRSNGYTNYGGSQARAVTPDGKYIFGRSGNFFDGIYWEAGSTEWNYVGEMVKGTAVIDLDGEQAVADVYNFVNIPADTKVVSPNGKYIAVSYYGPGTGPEGERVQYSYYPAVWDIEKMELVANLYEYDLDQDGNQVPRAESGNAICVGDDGRLFYIADPDFRRYYSMWHEGVVGSPTEWLNQMYGAYLGRNINIMFSRESPRLTIGTFSTDGSEVMFVLSQP